MTYEDRLRATAPTSSGETGLFTTITPDTLGRGNWSFGVYLNDYDLLAGRSPVGFLTARDSERMGYDLYRLNASIGVGITDRWELSASLPYDRLKSGGNDRTGVINGFPYVGKFTDSGLGDLHIGTKIRLNEDTASSRWALLGGIDVPTGDDDGGISTGDPSFGAGLSVGGTRGTIAGFFKKTGDRDRTTLPRRVTGGILQGPFTISGDVADELHLDLGWNSNLRWFSNTNWISEINSTFFVGGDNKPQNPIFLVPGFRH